MRKNAFDKELGLKVCDKRCGECLFSKQPIVSETRKQQVLADCSETGRYFLCHKAANDRNEAVVCRGFFDTEENFACHAAKRLGIVCFVDAKGEPVQKPRREDASRETEESLL